MATESGEKMDLETLNKSLENDKMDTEAETKSSDAGKMNTESANKSLEEDRDDIEMEKPCNNMDEDRNYDWNETIQPYVKITVIGERGCGKSSLILAAKNEVFPHHSEKFVSKQYPLDIEVNGETETCMVAEVKSGDEHFGSREKIYAETDVVLLCIGEADGYAHVEDEKKWTQELKAHIPDVPVLLVRIKKKANNETLYSEFIEVDEFFGFRECCPHEGRGVLEVFREAFKKAKGRKISEKK